MMLASRRLLQPHQGLPTATPLVAGPSGRPFGHLFGRPSRRLLAAASTSEEVGPKKPKRGAKGSPSPGGNGPLPGGPMPPPAASRPADGHGPPGVESEEEAEQFLGPYMDAVVKIYCIHSEPNFSMPWQRKRQYNSFSSGFAVSDGAQRWLLTNAHSVSYHTQVRVKRRGDDRKFTARVLSIGVDCDIALLTVEDDEFWADVVPLEFGPLPRLQESVAVVGYPIGGDTISVTAGVVSRIEVTQYSHGSTDLLAVQIDAAINGGNSGGPVFNSQGQCVGIAFQSLVGDDVENVGFIIPTPVVQHFLNDYKRTGGFSGFPALGVQWQRMESDTLRRAYGMAAGQKGVLVRNVNPTSRAAGVLKRDDVVMKFDGVTISCDGTVPFRTGERIAFSYLISQKYVGDTCSLEVLRGGAVLTQQVTLSRPSQLVPAHLSNHDPSYFLISGLLFTTCNEPYLMSEYGTDYGTDSPVKLLDKMYYGFPSAPPAEEEAEAVKGEDDGSVSSAARGEEEVVVLAQVLAADSTMGYEDFNNVHVLQFNGTPVRNLRHLKELVMRCSAPHMRFDLEYNEVVVIDTQEAFASTHEVMASHSIPDMMSADLKDAGDELRAAARAKAAAAAAAAGASKLQPAAGSSGNGKAARS